MSDPIKGFFRKYSAVPASDAGIDWRRADEGVLLDWFGRLAAIVRCGWNREAGREATAAERDGQRLTYEAVVAEIRRRAVRPDPSGEIMGAYFRSLDDT